MTIMIIGLVIFFTIHMFPGSTLKQRIVSKAGEGGYKGLFTVISIIGFVMIVYGKGNSELWTVWIPPYWTRHVTMLAMLIAFILLAIAHVPNNFRRKIRHPMLCATGLWGASHFLANGDAASMILSSSFVVFALVKIRSINSRSEFVEKEPVALKWNFVVLGSGVVAYLSVLFAHDYIAGIPLV